MSFRGGYRGRGGGGGGRRDDSFRGRRGGGGFKSKFGGSKFDKPSFSRDRDRFGGGGGRPDRGNDFRRPRQDDFRGDSGFRGGSPKRFRGDSGMNGGDRERSFKDFSSRGDSFDRGNRSDFPSRKSRGGRANFRSAPPPSRSSRGGFRRDSGFTTKSGFVSKKKDFPRKFVRGSSKREYFGRLKSNRYRGSSDDDMLECKAMSDDELWDEDEYDEYLDETAVDEEDDIKESKEDDEELSEDEDGKDRDDEDEQTSDKKVKDDSDKQEADASDKKKTLKKKVSSADAKKKESVTPDEDKKSSKSAECTKTDSTKDTSNDSPDDKAASDSKGKTVKKVIKKVVKKPSSDSLAKSDKEKEKKEKPAEGKGEKVETSSDDGEALNCPHCHFESSHVRVYVAHLKSKSHLLVMDRQLTGWKYKIKGIRLKQRKKQVFLDREARMLNLATFNCFICKLNYKTLKSEHLSSQPHRLLKKLLMPQCRICKVNFKSPGMYDAHICSVSHLRKKSKLEAELGTKMPNENLDELDDDDDELDPSNFMVVDAAESGDDGAEEVENDDEKSPKAKKSAKTLINIGAEMCKKVEVYYCEVCDIHLTRPFGKVEEALTYHCRNPKHLERFYRHRHRMNKKLEEQQNKEKESGGKEAKEAEKKKKKSVDDEKNDDVSLNSPSDAHIVEGEEEEEEHVDEEEEHFDDDEEHQDFEEGDDENLHDEEEEDDHHEQDDYENEEDVGEDEGVEEEEDDSKYKEVNADLTDLLDEAEEDLTADRANKDGDEQRVDKLSKSNGEHSDDQSDDTSSPKKA